MAEASGSNACQSTRVLIVSLASRNRLPGPRASTDNTLRALRSWIRQGSKRFPPKRLTPFLELWTSIGILHPPKGPSGAARPLECEWSFLNFVSREELGPCCSINLSSMALWAAARARLLRSIERCFLGLTRPGALCPCCQNPGACSGSSCHICHGWVCGWVVVY